MDFETEGCNNLNIAETLLLKAKVAETDSEIQNLMTIAESSMIELFSSSYPNRPNPAVHKTLNNVLDILNDKNQKKFPKNKFSFTKIREKPDKQKEPEIIKLVEKEEDTSNISNDPEFIYNENCIIKNMRNKRIFRFLKSDKMGYTNIENMEDSEIILLSVVDSSFISNVKNSIIWLSIANSSVMASDVYDSTIITCSRQLRITNCKNVKIFINSITPPTIELSTNITFSSNHLVYDGFEDHLKMSDLSGRFLEKMDSIKDFSWHHPQKSPNWEGVEKKSEHMMKIIKIEDGNELNTETFSEIDWEILKTL